MAEGLVDVPSLAVVATKRVIDVATDDECNAILQSATKRRGELADIKFHNALRGKAGLHDDDISPLRLHLSTWGGHVMLFVFDDIRYHLGWTQGGETYIKKCDEICTEANGHQRVGKTRCRVSEGTVTIGNPDRPDNYDKLGAFVSIVERLSAKEVKEVVDAIAKERRLKN